MLAHSVRLFSAYVRLSHAADLVAVFVHILAD